MSEDCCIDCDQSGILPQAWINANNFILGSPPFGGSGADNGCSSACLPCSGFVGSDGATLPRSFGLQYVSIDDGAGGYVETCTGSSGTIYPQGMPTPAARPTCCSLNVHGPNFGPPPASHPYDCDFQPDGATYTTCGGGPACGSCCQELKSITTPGGGTPTCYTACTYCCDTNTVFNPPWTWGCPMSIQDQCCCTKQTSPSCPTTYTTPSSTPSFCYCRSSGWSNHCNPFVWQAADGQCRFTGSLYSNDGATSTNEGFGEIYFDLCRKKWVLHSTYKGLSNQWPTGQYFYGECSNCSGLEKCEQENGYWYGSFKPDSGPGEAFVCMKMGSCDFPSSSKSKCLTAHGNLHACA